jgi:hypothetical protein
MNTIIDFAPGQLDIIVDLLDDYLNQVKENPENFVDTPEQVEAILKTIASQVAIPKHVIAFDVIGVCS